MWIRVAIIALFAAVIVSGMVGLVSTNAKVSPQYNALVISSFTASPNPTSVGRTTFINVTATGGSGTITYAFSGLPSGCRSTNTASLTCTPTATGSATIKVFVNDTVGQSTTDTVSLAVNAAGTLTVGSIQDTVSSGTYTFSVSVSGGTPPYTYAWNFGDGGTATSASPQHSYSKAAGYNVSVVVTDSAKNTKSVYSNIQVTQTGGLVIGTIVYTQPTDGTFDFSLSPAPSGGTTPYSYSWSFGDGGTSTSASPTYTYSNTGTFTVSVTVTDSAKNSKTATLNLPVTAIASNGGGNNNSTWLWIVVVVVVVAVAVILVVLILRKRKSSAKPPEQNPYDPNSPGNAPYDYQYSQAPPEAAPAADGAPPSYP
jgi:PKD repeat protein